MIDFHWYILFIAALVPLIVGFIWYNPKVLGNAWMKASGVTPDSAKGANMGLIFGLTYLFALFIAFIMCSIVIHQLHLFSLFANDPASQDPTSETGMMLQGFMQKYGTNFRTFKHGAFHGVIAGIFFAMPVIAINAMFERKGFKYIAINAGYFIVTLALMGGIICQWI